MIRIFKTETKKNDIIVHYKFDHEGVVHEKSLAFPSEQFIELSDKDLRNIVRAHVKKGRLLLDAPDPKIAEKKVKRKVKKKVKDIIDVDIEEEKTEE